MKQTPCQPNQKVIIHPGGYFATNEKIFISTLLGSCVAACLFDPVKKVMGMNHFLLSSETYKQKGSGFATLTGRYGVHAMELLINKMFKLGAARINLKAKAFGGATLREFANGNSRMMSVGETNMRFIREFLTKENIPLISEDLGGTQGRTIYFDWRDYSVYVRRHHPVDLSSLLEKEKKYQEGMKRHQDTNGDNITLWN